MIVMHEQTGWSVTDPKVALDKKFFELDIFGFICIFNSLLLVPHLENKKSKESMWMAHLNTF